MFEYISKILSKFTQRERVLVLILLLMSIITIMNGTSLINAVKGTPDNIKEKIIKLEFHNNELLSDLILLKREMVNNGIECTNSIIKRETEIRDEIRKLITVSKEMHQMSAIRPSSIVLDNTDCTHVSPMIIDVPSDVSPINDIIKELEKIEKRIVKN